MWTSWQNITMESSIYWLQWTCYQDFHVLYQCDQKVLPQKLWSDKGTEFKGALKNLRAKRGIATYTTASETKSAFAERSIRSLKKIMYKHMENKWTYHYISKLSQFVSTNNSRINR